MSKQIKLSVIIPCYNVEQFLGDLFSCLNDVEYQDVEFIFINDGSTDSTINKLNEYIKSNDRCVLINQNNYGPSIARNKGVDQSKGEYIMFLDSDDFVKPNSLKLIVEVLEKENADVLCIKSKKINEKTKYKKHLLRTIKYLKYNYNDLDYIYTQCMAMKDIYIGIQHMIFKKEVVEKMKNYPHIFKDIMGEDACFNLECLKLCKTILVSQDSYHFYRQRKGSLMHSKFNEKIITILSCNDILLDDTNSDEVKNHALGRNYLNSIYVLQKMISCKYKNANNIKYVYSVFKNNLKYFRKAKQISCPIRFFTPLCKPYFYFLLKQMLK